MLKKILESNLAKEMKDLYTEHYKTFPNKLKKTPIKQTPIFSFIRFIIKSSKFLSYQHIPSSTYCTSSY